MTMTNARIGLASLVLLGWLLPAQAAERSNRMQDHASPYLAMHGADPVHWQDWGPEVLEAAKRENKLIYVSSGYFACHWCHVMQRESFQHPQISEVLNREFIPVKVDRELHPALDARLLDFVERLQGYAGWPMNVFITPDGYPLLGTVYQPPREFMQIIVNLGRQWQADSDNLSQLARQAAAEMLQAGQAAASVQSPQQLRDRFIEQALSRADDLQGGFGDQTKFPSAPHLQALLSQYATSRDPRLRKFLILTLDAMANLGLRDHLGGGFFRYVVDPGWQVPHFEKMLYDNAQLASLYLDAARILEQPAYAQVGLETLDFLRREFSLANGGLISSLSALDDQDVEGGYYLWQADEVRKALTRQEWTLAAPHWGMDGPPELEHGHHLHIARAVEKLATQTKQPAQRIQSRLDSARAKLLKLRQQRQLPRDDKLIAAWNGLALSAFVRGARQDSQADRDSAQRLQQFLIRQLWDGEQLQRALAGQVRLGSAGLEDYAYVAAGLLDWAQLSGDAADLAVAQAVMQQAWQRYFDPQGWQIQEQPLLRYGARERVIADGPMPSASASLIASTRRLLAQKPLPELQGKLQQALQMQSPAMQDGPYWYASQIMQLQIDLFQPKT